MRTSPETSYFGGDGGARFGLGHKLLLFTVLLTAGVTLSAFAAMRLSIASGTEEIFSRQLSENHQALQNSRDEGRARSRSVSALITETPTLRAALETMRQESFLGAEPRPDLVRTLTRELEKIAALVGRDILVVTDDLGSVLAAQYELDGPAVGEDLSGILAVRRTLDPETTFGEANYAVPHFSESHYQAEVVPIVLQGFLIGALLIGDRIDESFVQGIRQQVSNEVVVASPDSVILSTLAGGEWVRALDEREAQVGLDAGTVPERVWVGEEEYLVSTMGLGQDELGRPVNVYIMRSLTEALKASTAELLVSFWLLCGLAVVAAVGVSALASKSFIKMVNRDAKRQKALEAQLATARKLESIGQLAAGIAHEINTPIQYVGDNTRFIQEGFVHLQGLIRQLEEVALAARKGPVPTHLLDHVDRAVEAADLTYLMDEIPCAIGGSLEGVGRVADIVSAMKDFSHVSSEKTPTDLNRAIKSTVTVASHEWKYVADLETDLDEGLPSVQCVVGQFNQVILNMVINSAHSVAEALGQNASRKGRITIRTRRLEGWVEVTVEDNGQGMTEEVRDRVFDPFFTTKPLGEGTGQGLSMAHTVVHKVHGGTIDVRSEPGVGTTFTIRLPLEPISAEEVAA